MTTLTKLSQFLFLLISSYLTFHCGTAFSSCSIGVNYGAIANNLPPPRQVANFLKTHTTINRVKLFDANPDFLGAFGNTNISVTVTIGNGDIPALAKLPAAQSWIARNILPHRPQTIIRYISAGNEVLATSDKNLIAHLLPCMRALKSALNLAKLSSIKVTTPHSLVILSASEPPSVGRFRRGYDEAVIAKILKFHNRTKSPFMVNPYPYFGFRPQTLNYALFKPNAGVFDPATGKYYTNMFDAQLDAVYSAMKKVGYGNVDIVVGETGWPSAGDPNQPDSNLQNALLYNGNLVKHVNSGKGTPLMPNRIFEVYIFALFNENLKPSISEQKFGLFRPDFSPVYDVGILRGKHKQMTSIMLYGLLTQPVLYMEAMGTSVRTQSGQNTIALNSNQAWLFGGDGDGNEGERWIVAKTDPGSLRTILSPQLIFLLQSTATKWCIPKADATAAQLQGYRIGLQAYTGRSPASYATNAYYEANGQDDYNCDFGHTRVLTSRNQSTS
ncbi:glucan endo-1,3-beta-glucosidase-like [Mangifera indica]|uniref:glucan endo-1,3-beta-glucosidase-like n=1 Tax=Mangifera indica TaxID=29780 RepID=UPI001CFB87EE|nr:glucan endo-1,3-beta-glucosidase-like [Mangifera indica]